MATVIDTLVTRFAFQADKRGLREAERSVDTFGQRSRRVLAGVGRGLRLGVTALSGLAGVAFFTGSTAEREFLKLRTQLGLSAEEVAAIRPEIVALSRETARPLAELAEGYFSLRSAGLDAATAQDALRASAYAANGQLGRTREIAHVAGGALNAYEDGAYRAERVTDILIGTVKEGNLVAENLTRGFGELLQVAPLLGVDLESLGAIIAGATRTGIPANQVMTQLKQVLFGLLRPTETAKKNFAALGIDISDVQRRIRDDGLIATLQWLREEVGEDTETFTRFFESQEAVGLILEITGNKSDDFRQILANLRNETGQTNEAQQQWAEQGFATAEKASNDAKLSLDSFYNDALVPLLGLFGQLPTPIQQVVVLFGVLSGVSLLFFGNALVPLIAGLVIFLLKLGLIAGAVALIIAALHLAGNVGREFRRRWDEALGGIGEWTREQWGRFTSWLREQWEKLPVEIREPIERIAGMIGTAFDALGTRVRETWDAAIAYIEDNLPAPIVALLRSVGVLPGADGQHSNPLSIGTAADPEGIGAALTPTQAAGLHLGRFIAGFLNPPDSGAGATAPPVQVADNRTFTVAELTVVAAPGQSAAEVARQVPKAIRTEFGDVPAAFDSGIRR